MRFHGVSHSVLIVICGIGELEQRKISLCLWVWSALLCGLEVLMICELENSRHNRSKGNVLCFGKLQQGFTFSCSRLTVQRIQYGVHVTRSDRNGLTRYRYFRHEVYIFGYMLASRCMIVWLRPCNTFPYCHGLIRARRKTGTE
jgi:hypothetical protein